jgi:hypothetical protein
LARDSNTPDVYLSYLRQKLGPNGRDLIHTVRGLGYTLKVSSPANVIVAGLRTREDEREREAEDDLGPAS